MAATIWIAGNQWLQESSARRRIGQSIVTAKVSVRGITSIQQYRSFKPFLECRGSQKDSECGERQTGLFIKFALSPLLLDLWFS